MIEKTGNSSPSAGSSDRWAAGAPSGLGGKGPILLDPQLLHLSPQRGAAHAKQLSGAGAHAARLFERRADRGAVGIARLRRGASGRDDTAVVSVSHFGGQVLRLNRTVSGADRGAFQDRKQLAHVSRPAVRL